MQTLNNTDLAMLSVLAHWKLTVQVLRLYSGGTVVFSPAIWPYLSLMWSTYMGLIKTHKKNINRDLVAATLSEAVQAEQNIPDEMKQKCDEILTRLVREDIPTLEEGTEFVTKAANMAFHRKIASDIQKGLDFDKIESSISSAKKKLADISVEEQQNKILYRPLKEIETLAVYQERIPTGINWLDELTSGGGREKELWLILGPTGGGKCLDPETPVLMFDGTIKKAKDIQVGDRLMGPDSRPRNVLKLGAGRSTMYRITPVKGDPYVVNDAHILTLVWCAKGSTFRYNGQVYKQGDLVDMPVEDYLKQSKYARAMLKGIRTGVEFSNLQPLPLDPYFLGLYLGDGTRRAVKLTLSDPVLISYCIDYAAERGWKSTVQEYKDEKCWDVSLGRKTHMDEPVNGQVLPWVVNDDGDKYIHSIYKTASRNVRLHVLAGLLDTDGYMHHGHYEITTKFDTLAEDILFLARSLGYAAYDNHGPKICYNTGAVGMYHRITISGDFKDLPALCGRIKPEPCKQIKNVLHTGITVEKLPEGPYCGFEIDGDGRFLLGDFTITHNTVLTVQYACAQALMGNATLWATYEQPAEGDIAERIIACVTDISLDVIRDKGFDNLPEDVKRKFWSSVQGAEDNMYMLDMTKIPANTSEDPKNNGGMYTVWEEYKKLKDQGIKIKTVIVDWFGAMMSVVAAVSNKDLDKGYRFVAQAEIDIARKMAKEENLFIIFLHQVNTEALNMRPTALPNKTVAADMRSLAFFMDMQLIIGNKDVHNICWITNPKSRKGASIHKTVQLIGDKCRFVNAPGWAPDRDGNFYNQSDVFATEGAPPTAEGGAGFSREID